MVMVLFRFQSLFLPQLLKRLNLFLGLLLQSENLFLSPHNRNNHCNHNSHSNSSISSTSAMALVHHIYVYLGHSNIFLEVLSYMRMLQDGRNALGLKYRAGSDAGELQQLG